MLEVIQLGDIPIFVTLKNVRNVHLSVHPPDGHVTLVAPTATRLEVVRAFAISKLAWIRAQQQKLLSQARETPRQFVERESHYLWGDRYLLSVVEQDAKPKVALGHSCITLMVRPGSDVTKRAQVFHEWHKSLLHEAIPPLIQKWELKLDVRVERYFLQRMKTHWGSCNTQAGRIRLNTELVKKPRDLLEYVIVHELVHLREPNHGKGFIALLDQHYPSWRAAHTELNTLPLAAEWE